MSFVAHTPQIIAEMLAGIGCKSVDELFVEIPQELQVAGIDNFAPRMTEMQVAKLMLQRSLQDKVTLNFIGAGCYEHYIPAAVWELVSRGEFLTSYTPYQAEASQGTLQLLYEYQTMLANLTALDVSNASLYDGASALAEAILMSVRCYKNPSNKKILLPKSVHPYYRQVVKTIISPQQIEIEEIDYDFSTGQIDLEQLNKYQPGSFLALVIPQPNFFGVLEEVDYLTDWAHKNQAFAIGLVNPLALGILKPPGEWATSGVDIACGEAQSLGVPLSSGGPYIGFLCCKRALIRQLPGRLVGMTVDVEGKRGFTLTLQAREQHIRRAKATSNICTNQGLLATAVAIHLSLMGASGLRQAASISHANAIQIKQAFEHDKNIKVLFDQSPCFHEIVLQFSQPIKDIQDKLSKQGIQAGFNLLAFYPELGNALLCCATETKTNSDIDQFIRAIKHVNF